MNIRPIGSPVEIISLALIAEFVGLDSDIDAPQDNVLPVLRDAAVELGEQYTGAIWAETQYLASGSLEAFGLCLPFAGNRQPLRLPLTPVTVIDKITVTTGDGENELVPADWKFQPSSIETGQPWAEVLLLVDLPTGTEELSITFKAGWTEETLPAALKNWALTRIATSYDIRADQVTGTIAVQMPRSHSDALLDRYTVPVSAYGY